MTALSTHVLGNSGITRPNVFAPFTVYARFQQHSANPMSGNRWEKYRAEQYNAELIERSLRTLVEEGETAGTEDDFELYIAFPIAFTRQFGQEPSRITISGRFRGSAKEIDTSGETEPHFPPKKTVDDIDQINANELRTGQGAFNAANLDPKDVVRQFAVQIRDLFSDSSRIDFIDRVEVIAVEVFGIRYGRGGRHFSPPK